jgi:hypothetical protein
VIIERRIEDARAPNTRNLGQHLSRKDQQIPGEIAEPLKHEYRMGDVVEDA